MFSQAGIHSSAHLWFMNSLETYLVIFEPLSINFTAHRDLSSTHCANTTKPKAPARNGKDVACPRPATDLYKAGKQTHRSLQKVKSRLTLVQLADIVVSFVALQCHLWIWSFPGAGFSRRTHFSFLSDTAYHVFRAVGYRNASFILPVFRSGICAAIRVLAATSLVPALTRPPAAQGAE